DCPAAPFAHALLDAKDPGPLYEALLQARAPASGLDKALSQRLRKNESDPRIPQLAAKYRVAGTALVERLRREQAARARQLGQRQPPADEDSAAESAKSAAPPAPDKERYAQLMSRLHERQGAEEKRSSAAAQIDALLRAGGESDRRDFIAAALRAASALRAPGAGKVAASFSQDPDSAIAAAARGEPLSAMKKPPASATLDAHTALWSADGATRAEACAATRGDRAEAAVRAALAKADPERRVRLACSAANETEPGK